MSITSNSSVQILTPKEFLLENAIYINKDSILKLDGIFIKWRDCIVERYSIYKKNEPYAKDLSVEVILELENGTKLVGPSAFDVFKRLEASDYHMKSLKYVISDRYPDLVKIEIDNSYTGRIRLVCNTLENFDFPVDDCFYDFKDWIVSIEASKLRKIFVSICNYFSWTCFPLFIAGLQIPSLFRRNTLKEEAKELLKDGFNVSESHKALEILLKEYAGEVVKIGPSWESDFYLYYLIASVFLFSIPWLVKPFAIELGKGKRNYIIQKFLAITFPSFIFLAVFIPFIVNKISAG